MEETKAMADEQRAERLRQMRDGVGKDGSVEGNGMETYLAHVYALHNPQQYGFRMDPENKFVAFAVDGSGHYLEVRLPFETVKAMQGWIDKAG